VSREFLHLEAALANQEESLEHFLNMLTERGFFGRSFSGRAARILAGRVQVGRLIKTYRAIATELRETNLALLEARQNEIMKTLTIVNFIFLPLGLISWIFAMRTEGMPLVDSPADLKKLKMEDLPFLAEEIRELILDRASTTEICRAAVKQGMLTLRDDGLLKIQKGITTIEEVLRETAVADT